jgi:hypothetical protein
VVPIAHGSPVVTRRVQLKRARFRDNGFIEGKKRFQLCFVASHSAVEVGFLGTGRMGKVMAANLLKAGHRVRAWNKSSEPLHELKRAGADIATTAADAFRGDAVISMLPNDQALREVFIEGDLLVPAPRQKAPQISPIFKADTVRLHVSREKEKDWDDTKVVQPDGCGQARRGGRVDPTPRQRGEMTPLSKTRTPLRTPWFFTSYRWPLTCIEPGIFCPRFGVALRVTVPFVMRNGPP